MIQTPKVVPKKTPPDIHLNDEEDKALADMRSSISATALRLKIKKDKIHEQH